MSANGLIAGVQEPVPLKDENDRYVVIFVHYGDFQYILDGDLGAGPEACASHQTGQRDVETHSKGSVASKGPMIWPSLLSRKGSQFLNCQST